MIKLCRARSLLYRRQILEENIRWKALDEIYKIYMLLHRSDLKNSEKKSSKISAFFDKIQKLQIFEIIQSLMKIRRNFANIFEHVEKS